MERAKGKHKWRKKAITIIFKNIRILHSHQPKAGVIAS